MSALLAAFAAFALFTVIATPQAQAVPLPPGDSGNSSFVFYDMSTRQCLDLPNYGYNGPNTPVTQYQCNTSDSGDNQGWTAQWTRTINGVDLYQFQNDKSGECLDLPDYGADPAGTHLYTYWCASSPADDNQEWYFTIVGYDNNGKPEVLIQNYKSNGLCLDVSGWASDLSDSHYNLPLTVYYCGDPSWKNYYDDHVWQLYPTT